MKNLEKKYEKLEKKVLKALRKKIEKSDYISKYIKEKAIQIYFDHYTEISVVNDRLVCIDEKGYSYDLLFAVKIEDLIDILHPSSEE